MKPYFYKIIMNRLYGKLGEPTTPISREYVRAARVRRQMYPIYIIDYTTTFIEPVAKPSDKLNKVIKSLMDDVKSLNIEIYMAKSPYC